MLDFSSTFQKGVQFRAQEVAWSNAIRRSAPVEANVPDAGSNKILPENFEVYKVLRLSGMSERDAQAAAQAISQSGPQKQGGESSMALKADSLSIEVSQVSANANTANGTVNVSSQTASLSWNSSEQRLDLANGTVQSESTEIRIFTREIQLSIGATPAQADPLVLDLTGEGLRFTGADKGQWFDIHGDGSVKMTSWIEGNNLAFLALDRNGNGVIESGKELFGDQHGAADGFAELSKFDENADGKIDQTDSVFHMLVLLSPKGQTQSLEQAGITQLHISGAIAKDVRHHGANETAQNAFTRADGSQGKIHDVWLDVQA